MSKRNINKNILRKFLQTPSLIIILITVIFFSFIIVNNSQNNKSALTKAQIIVPSPGTLGPYNNTACPIAKQCPDGLTYVALEDTATCTYPACPGIPLPTMAGNRCAPGYEEIGSTNSFPGSPVCAKIPTPALTKCTSNCNMDIEKLTAPPGCFWTMKDPSGCSSCQGSLICLTPNPTQPQNNYPTVSISSAACPQDTTLCPNGSVVSRTGQNCAFPACPGKPAPTNITSQTPVSAPKDMITRIIDAIKKLFCNALKICPSSTPIP